MATEPVPFDGTDWPNAVEVEAQVIGSLMFDVDRIGLVERHGGEALFYDPIHALIYRTIQARAEKGQQVTPHTLGAELADVEGLRALGGQGYIGKMFQNAVLPHMIEASLETLSKVLSRRAVLKVARELMQSVGEERADPAQAASMAEERLSRISRGATYVKGEISSTASVTSTIEDWMEAGNPEAKGRLVKTGLKHLDDMIGGFAPGDYTLIGARPSMGKTALAVYLAVQATMRGHPVIFASLEMVPNAITARALSLLSYQYSIRGRSIRGHGVIPVEFRKILNGEGAVDGVGRALVHMGEVLNRHPFFYLDDDFIHASTIASGIRGAIRRFEGNRNTPLVIVDYLQLMRSTAQRRYDEITDISITLKTAAKRDRYALVALSQLSRGNEAREDRRPRMSDLRESGQLEQDADRIILLHRDEYYLQREEPSEDDIERYAAWEEKMNKARERLDLIVAKQRNGAVGVATVGYKAAFNALRTIEHDLPTYPSG